MRKSKIVKTDTYRKLPVASQLQTEYYLNTAAEFLNTTGGLYSSYGSEAKTAIADYLAYINGFQLKRN